MLKSILSVSLVLISIQSFSQDIAGFTVYAGDVDRIDCPVSVPLDQIMHNEDRGNIMLLEKAGNKEIPAGIVHQGRNLLHEDWLQTISHHS
ncbi:unnamed protein product [marine sediment metagenome]|uniref:Uncharacterized protein n=1 Tax=marine sediment metagenome TaxID=412755 RepID=X1I0I5_9ZZZZ